MDRFTNDLRAHASSPKPILSAQVQNPLSIPALPWSCLNYLSTSLFCIMVPVVLSKLVSSSPSESWLSDGLNQKAEFRAWWADHASYEHGWKRRRCQYLVSNSSVVTVATTHTKCGRRVQGYLNLIFSLPEECTNHQATIDSGVEALSTSPIEAGPFYIECLHSQWVREKQCLELLSKKYPAHLLLSHGKLAHTIPATIFTQIQGKFFFSPVSIPKKPLVQAGGFCSSESGPEPRLRPESNPK